MRIALLSDLHLSVQAMPVPPIDADVVVLAGDLGRPPAAMEWARAIDAPTLFVAGNHEFYGSDLQTTMADLRRLARGTRITVLERDEWRSGGVRFLGCTLWSDHRLYRSPEEREIGLARAIEWIADFTRIGAAPGAQERLTPELAQQLCDQSVAWLDAKLAEPHDGPTVVITHFAPSRQSIHPRFADSPINACFVSDLEDRIRRWQPALWLHGHTHDSFDYRIGRTRVVSNPRGYAPQGKVENERFDPGLVLELDAA